METVMKGAKHVEINLSPEEYDFLVKKKGNRSWKQFLMEVGARDDSVELAIERINEVYGLLEVKFEGDERKDLLEFARVLTIFILRRDPGKAKEVLAKIGGMLDALIEEQKKRAEITKDEMEEVEKRLSVV